MVLHHYSRVSRQEFGDSSKCLVYNGAHHAIPHGELNEIILALEYICTFTLIGLSFQIAVCASITALVSLRSSMYKNTLTDSVAFKKIKLRSRDTISSQLACDSQNGNSNVPSETNDSIKSPVCVTGELSTEIKFSRSHSAM